jgi:hypothetical protein
MASYRAVERGRFTVILWAAGIAVREWLKSRQQLLTSCEFTASLSLPNCHRLTALAHFYALNWPKWRAYTRLLPGGGFCGSFERRTQRPSARLL